MEEFIQSKEPVVRLGFPIWFHKHGMKMYLEQLDPGNQVIIAGSAAKVTIRKASLVCTRAKGWFVDWKVVQCRPFEEGVCGRICLNDDELRAAFGFSERSGKFGKWIIEQFGADSAEQGKYIRWQNFLNIPCPGTGHDGDPNISVHLSEEISKAVSQLLEQSDKPDI